MPKKPRSELPPGLVHVTMRGNRRADIFTAERDVRRFEEFFEDAVRRSGITCHAVCLMPNHFHLVLYTETIDALSVAMQRVNGRYAQWFNLQYGFNGHVFQGPYWARPVESEQHLMEVVRYVLLNPVRAGLCTRPAAWPWSSYLATIGAAERPRYLMVDWLLSLFAGERTLAQERLKTFVAEGIAAPTAPSRPHLSRDLDRGRSRDRAWQASVGRVPSTG